MDISKLKDNWPAVVLGVAVITAFVVTAIFAPPEVARWLLSSEGLLATGVALWLRSPKDR